MSQKQALVNAFKYVCNPILTYQRRHPSVGLPCKNALMNTRLVHVGHTQSTFAGAKVQKIFDVNKF